MSGYCQMVDSQSSQQACQTLQEYNICLSLVSSTVARAMELLITDAICVN